MRNNDQYKRLLTALAGAVLLLGQTTLFAHIWFRFYGELGANLFVRGNLVLIGLYWLMSFFFHNLFGFRKLSRTQVWEQLGGQVFAVCCTNLVVYLQLCLICRWRLLTNFEPVLLLTALELVYAVLVSFLVRRLFRRLYPPREVLLIYGTDTPEELISKLRTQSDRYRIREAVSVDRDGAVLRRKILEIGTVVLTDTPDPLRGEVLKFCFERDIRCYCVPTISDVMVRSARSVRLMDTTLLLFRNMGLTADQRWVKRGLDILLAIAALVLLSPVLLLIALVVKLTDGGPVVFTQDRLTEGGRLFRVYKFRSMRPGIGEEPYILTRKGDERVTGVGKVLRRFHLDELPQLLNILKGDMSFVGPRPECPKLAEEYEKSLPQFRYRLKVRAGLTGFAQVYGKYNSTPGDKLKLDLHYIENYSLLLDLKLMLLTAKTVFGKEHNEGIEPWQTSASREKGVQL